MKFESKPDSLLRQIAMDKIDGKIWFMIDGDGRSFDAPILMSGNEVISAFVEENDDSPFLIYEYLSEACSLLRNGYPMFLSMNILNRADAEKVFNYMQEFQKAKQALLNS